MRMVDDLPPRSNAKQPRPVVAPVGCLEPFKEHDLDKAGVCRRCGYEAPYQRRSRSSPPPGPSRTTKTSPKKDEVETVSISQNDLAGALSVATLLLQKLAVSRYPVLKEDALNPLERMLLADALAEELFTSQQIKKWLAKAKKQKKHAKLATVLTVILLPRMNRHLMQVMGEVNGTSLEMDEEMLRELQKLGLVGPLGPGVPQAAPVAGSGGGTPAGQPPDFMSVPVATGGPHVVDRGNGVGEVDLGGVGPESAPFRGGAPDEDRRSDLPSTGGGEVPPDHVEQPGEPLGASAGQAPNRSPEGRTIGGVPVGG